MDLYDSYGTRKRKGSFIGALAAVVFAFVIVKYVFHYDVLDLLNNPKINPFFDKSYGYLITFWHLYIEPVAIVAKAHALTVWNFAWVYIQPALAKLKEILWSLFHTI